MSALVLVSFLGIIVLYLGLFARSEAGKAWLAPVGILGLLGALAFFVTGWNINVPLIEGMLHFDPLATAFNCALIVITALLFLFGVDYYRRMTEYVAEHYALMIFSLVGGLLLTSYQNLLVFFLGIEILSIPVYILAGGKKRSLRSGEASFKYFLLGSFATAFLLMGIALTYGVCASFDLAVIADKVAHFDGALPPLQVLGFFFIGTALAFKVAAVPFHFWSPDVYEGAPTLITAYMATVVKMAAFAGFYRLIATIGLSPQLTVTLTVVTVMTLVLGNLVALRQSNFKRLMAYSSIAHTGFLLMALISGDGRTGQVLFYYTFTYSLASVGLFLLLTLAKRAANGREDIRILRGLSRNHPLLAVTALLLLLSLAGIPLTAGFLAKYQVFVLAITGGFIKTAVVAVLMALVGIYYYIQAGREAFTPPDAGREAPALIVTPLNAVLITACGLSVIVFALCPALLGL